MGMGMSTGMGGLQSLVSQLGGQGASGNPYVSPMLTAQPATPRQGPTPQGGYDSSGNQNMNQLMNTTPMGSGSPLSSFKNIDPNGVMGGERKPIPQATPEQQKLMQESAPQGGFAALSGLLSGRPTNPMYAQPATSNVNPNTNPGSFAGPNVYPGFSGAGASSSSAGGSGGPFPLQGQYGIVKMANGGLAGAAQNMAGRGRDGDSMLVHMSPGEVKGLQALAMAHGGSLSINPDTGLVEASFLKRMLPMIAGIGLNMMFPGLGALATAGIVGGVETVRTGDIGKGLMAGLGAYGGAGIGQGLSSAGASTLGETAAGTAFDSSIANQGLSGAETAMDFSNPLAEQAAATARTGVSTTPSLTNMGEGVSQLGTPAGRSAIYNATPTGTLPALGATAVNAMTPEMPAPPGEKELDEKYKRAPYSYSLSPDFRGSTPTRPNPYYTPAGLGYAAGGDIMMADGGAYDDESGSDDNGMAMGGIAGYAAGGLKMKTMGIGDGIYKDTDDDTASLGAYDAAMKRMEKQFAAGNLKPQMASKSGITKLGQMKAMANGGLGSYSDGGRMLKGPGDGMSDDIPAMIGKKQPARLADGEFVVPADVVSHLGNGSTDAGARKLYSMMDKVRTARTGKKKQAPSVKTDRYMPA